MSQTRYSKWTPWQHYIFYEQRICRSYNLQIEDIVNLMNKQKGQCPICTNSLTDADSDRNFHIDHNHSTGKVRALLCHHCNSLLGNAKEDTETLKRAIAFLEEHNNG